MTTTFLLAVLTLKEIFAPTVVGVPPTFAVRDLCVTADGEIRHYGKAMVDGSVQRVYVASRDNGLSWTTRLAATNDVGAMVKSPWSGDWIYFTGMEPVTLVRSKVGPGDTKAERTPMPWRKLELRQIIPLKSRKRWLAAFSNVACEGDVVEKKCYHATTAYSDDDGRTWTRVDLKPVADVARLGPGDRMPHWFNNGCEPTIVELKDGSILLCARTSGPNAAFYRSTDGGETWGEGRPDPAFWQANTMPYFFRLKDGRLLFVWNNTAILPTRDVANYPELGEGERNGTWETVFTNRDALHAAISDDDGKTWKGFRELILDEIRNDCDFRELGNFPSEEHDKSVHQTQALELPGGKVLLALGQNAAARRMIVFDPNWLLETSRREDFRHGLGGLSNHLYVRSLTGSWRGWAGHCAWNRVPGALLVRDPYTDNPPPGWEGSNRSVLQLCRIRDPRLVSDRQGVAWNFPAARQGLVTLECRIAGKGFRLTLADHWMNPCDETGPARSPFSVCVDLPALREPGWHLVAVKWDCTTGKASLAVNGKVVKAVALASVPRFGLSYLHLQTLAEETDAEGTYFRSFNAWGGHKITAGADWVPLKVSADIVSEIDPLSSDAVLTGRAERDNWGVPTRFGRKGSPAVVNPLWKSPATETFSLGGKWEFVGTDQSLVYGAKPWQLPAKGGLPARITKDDAWEKYKGITIYSPKGPAKSRWIEIPGFWEVQGVGESGYGHPYESPDRAPYKLRHVFYGSALMRRIFTAPASWKGKQIWLKVGGVQSLAYIWIGERPAAVVRQSCGTYKFNVTDLITPGKPFPVAMLVHNDVGSKFSMLNSTHHMGGFYRDLELEITDDVWLDDVWGTGDFDRKTAEVHVSVRGIHAGEKTRVKLALEGETFSKDAASGDDLVFRVPLRNFRPWSCEHPNLYRAEVTLERNGRVVHGWNERFGIRKLEVADGKFRLNGHPFFLRGAGNHAKDPQTVVTMPDRARLLAQARAVRDAGFNATRHHTNTPHPEYFEAADECGILVEPELPYACGGPVDKFPYDPIGDLAETIRHRRRHVSFALVSFGNEGHVRDCETDLYAYAKRYAPQVLVVHNDGGYNEKGVTDFFTGPCNVWTPGDLREANHPLVCHEYLNVAIKQDPRVESRFDGVLLPPRTMAAYEAELARAGIGRDWGDRILDSAVRLQAHYQRAGLEFARADPDCEGYSFWSLTDCGASTDGPAVAQGVLTYFMEPKKGGLSYADLARFNAPSVLLLKPSDAKFVWSAGERYAADVLLSAYGERALAAGKPVAWKLASGGAVLASGELPLAGSVAAGPARKIAALGFEMPSVRKAAKVSLEVSYDGLVNAWDLWLFPKRAPKSGASLAVDRSILAKVVALYPGAVALDDPAAAKRPLRILPWSEKAPPAAKGQRTLFISQTEGEPNVRLGWWWLGDQVGTAFADHPALAGLPHDGSLSPLFFRILKKGRPLPFAPVPSDRLIAVGEGRDRYFCYLGGDRTALYAFGLDVLNGTPEAASLLDGLIDYLSAGFRPAAQAIP